MRTRFLLSVAAVCASVASVPSLAATTIVDFAFVNGGSALATGSFSFDSSLGGPLTYSNLNAFTLALPNETYDLAFVNSGGFSQYYYFGYDTTLGAFQTATVGGFPQILSAIKTGFTDGFFVRNDPGGTILRNYNPESGNVSFTNVTVSSRTIGAAVPEPATWAMMLFGFAAVGFSMRRRKQKLTVSYA